MLSKSFYNKLNKISSELGMNPRDLLLVMYSESGLQAGIINQDKQYGGAVGLIQFMPDTLRGLGVPKNEVKDFGKKSAEDQLDYVKKYIQGQMGHNNRPFKSASEYYHANFFPKTLKRWKGSDPIENANTIIVSKKSNDVQERIAYKANKSLDTNNDGNITVGDMTAVLMRNANKQGFQQALSQLNSVAGQGEVTEVTMDPKLLNTKKALPEQQLASKSSPILEQFLEKTINFFSSLLPSLSTTAEKDNNFLIVINAEDLITKAEYARILQSVIQEELKAYSSIHSDDKSVELVCSLPFSMEDSLRCLEEVCSAVSDVFKFATAGCDVETFVVLDEESDYPEIDIKTAEINRRKFRLKLARGDK